MLTPVYTDGKTEDSQFTVTTLANSSARTLTNVSLTTKVMFLSTEVQCFMKYPLGAGKKVKSESVSYSVVSDSLQPHGL